MEESVNPDPVAPTEENPVESTPEVEPQPEPEVAEPVIDTELEAQPQSEMPTDETVPESTPEQPITSNTEPESTFSQAPVKQKTNVLFFTLGIITPFAASWLTSILSSWLYSLSFNASGDYSGFSVAYILYYIPLLLILVFIYLFALGKKKNNVKLWSFAKGALAAYVVVLVGVLLLFGACFISLGNFGK